MKAFTLFEVLLAMAIGAMLMTVPFAINSTTIYRIQVETVQSQVGDAFRKAQNYAKSSRLDSDWGVYIQTRTITVFKGSTYATRDTAFDDSVAFDTKISMSATAAEIVFAKATGNTGTSSTITIFGGPNTKTVTYTANGNVVFN